MNDEENLNENQDSTLRIANNSTFEKINSFSNKNNEINELATIYLMDKESINGPKCSSKTELNRKISESVKNIKSENDSFEDNSNAKQEKIEKKKSFFSEKRIEKLKRILNNLIFEYIILLSTIFALIGDDIRVIFLSKSEDLAIDLPLIFCTIIFIIEIVLSSLAKPSYINGFFFWLDCFSTISIIFDLSWVEKRLSSANSISQVNKTSLIGSRMARMLRVFRLVRLSKLYKKISENQKRHSLRKIAESRANSVFFIDLEMNDSRPERKKSKKFDENDIKESRVGEKLSIKTTKILIILVLLMVMIIPLFNSYYFFDPRLSFDGEMILLVELLKIQNFSNANLNITCNNYFYNTNQSNYPLLFLKTPFINIPSCNFINKDVDLFDLREDEYQIMNYELNYQAIIDKRFLTIRLGILSFIRTIFVGIILILGAYFFYKDSHDLALKPIEKLMNKVDLLARNPVSGQKLRNNDKEITNEFFIIENAIIKISDLLFLSFGQAGSNIISANLTNTGDLDMTIKGNKIYGIFANINIKYFEEKLVELEENSLVFINQIIDIIDRVMFKFEGASYWNFGENIILIWKFKNSENKFLEKIIEFLKNTNFGDSFPKNKNFNLRSNVFSQTVIGKNEKQQVKILKNIKERCSISILSLLKIIYKLNKINVSMNVGIDLGWGIEGIVGSEFKIDANYFSSCIIQSTLYNKISCKYNIPIIFNKNIGNLLIGPLKVVVKKIENYEEDELLYFDLILKKNQNEIEGFNENFNELNNYNAKGLLKYDDEIKNIVKYYLKSKEQTIN